MEESETHHFGRFPRIPKPLGLEPEVTSDERIRRIEKKVDAIMTALSDLLAQETALSAEVAQLITAFQAESATIASLQKQLDTYADDAEDETLTEISIGLATSLANIQAVLPPVPASPSSASSTVVGATGSSTVAGATVAGATGSSTVAGATVAGATGSTGAASVSGAAGATTVTTAS